MTAHRHDHETTGEPAERPLTAVERVKEVCRLLRLARRFWDEHHNTACRDARTRALRAYEALAPEEREQVPQVLRVWLRYRSEKYFGPQRTPPRRRRPGA